MVQMHLKQFFSVNGLLIYCFKVKLFLLLTDLKSYASTTFEHMIHQTPTAPWYSIKLSAVKTVGLLTHT